MKKIPLEVRPSLFPLIPLFLENMFTEHEKLITAIKSSDVDQLVFLCHANKGAAAIYGCHTLGQMFQDLEDCARLANWEQSISLVREIDIYLTNLSDNCRCTGFKNKD